MIAPGAALLLDLTLATAAENVALDEVLLRTVERTPGEPVLRLWELDSYAVVVGRANRVAKNVHVEACRRDGVPIVRRFSGGGTVLLGPGALVFTLILPVEPQDHLANIGAATALILDRIGSALGERLGPLEKRGTSDLAMGEFKVSGNAQRWLRRTLLHHGTLLYDFDLDRIERYLTVPEREPEYRRHRSHREFVTNLRLCRESLKEALVDAWKATQPPPAIAMDDVRTLVESRYQDRRWTFRL